MCQVFFFVKSVITPQNATITSKVCLNNVPVCVYELSVQKSYSSTGFLQGKGHIFTSHTHTHTVHWFIKYFSWFSQLINNQNRSGSLRNPPSLCTVPKLALHFESERRALYTSAVFSASYSNNNENHSFFFVWVIPGLLFLMLQSLDLATPYNDDC